MPTGELIKAKDGEIAIEVGPWAKDKLFYIQRYCDIFNKGMKNIWNTRTYVDLFSGPGKGVISKTKEEIMGSPLLALSGETSFTHYFFNDLQKDIIEALKIRSKPFTSVNIQFFNDDCNEAATKIAALLPQNSLDFCFVDPLNWEIHFDSIRKITLNRRMDLAITFHLGNIKRVANNPPKELLDFFPNNDWQDEYKNSAGLGKSTGTVLLESYKKGLRDIGYIEIKDYVVERNSKNVPMYYLIFATKSTRGADFWDKIAMRSESGQMRMMG